MTTMEISSRENPRFGRLLKLTQKKYRRELGLCIVEGEKLVRELNGAEVFIRKSLFEKYENFKDAVILDDKLFNEISALETNQGILAVVPIPSHGSVTFPYLVLDRISDTGNVGTLLRSSAAFGFRTVFCINCADVWSQKVMRAAAGMQFGLNIIETDYNGFEQFFIHSKTTLLVADMNGAKVPFGDMKEPFGIVLGNEGQGVSDEIKALPHKVITIPMETGCESLNVAVAGGILMYLIGGENVRTQ